jgi:hypothetical protein
MWVAPGQVCSTFAKPQEAHEHKDPGKIAGKINIRHRNWLLKRVAPLGAAEGWRPQKRHRTSTEKWVRNLDCQIQYGTAWSGLSHVKYEANSSLWSPQNWQHWPCVHTVQDQGGDGLSGWHSMAYYSSLNTTCFWDWAHGAARDLEGSLKAMKMWPFVILLMVAHNLGHGPEKDECLRFHQMNEALSFFFSTFDAANSELFLAYSKNMLDELGSRVCVQMGKAHDAQWCAREAIVLGVAEVYVRR